MTLEEILYLEEDKHITTVVGQFKQSMCCRKESAKDRTVTWSDIKQMESKILSFLIKAVHNILPLSDKLNLWGGSLRHLTNADHAGKLPNSNIFSMDVSIKLLPILFNLSLSLSVSLSLSLSPFSLSLFPPLSLYIYIYICT